MGRASGAGGLIALLAVLVLMSKQKLTSASFAGAFEPSRDISYSSYYQYVTKEASELEAGEAFEEQTTLGGKTGRWLTVNGRIPTPRGTTIPIPTVHVGRTAVETMLQPIEEAKEEPHFQDVGGRRSVNLRLKPI